MPVIEISGLRKDYRRLRGGKTVALAGLDLQVEAGGVFGFLGPNGSGKTTTIRCLLGLARPTAGTCRVFGVDSNGSLHQVIRKIGSIVEAPGLFPTMSGRRNLQLLARIHGIGDARIEQVLETVGLRDRARDLVKTYSLGMRQRLGIAAALLKDPELIILDEPANGLDPAGIVEVRQLLRRLGSEGKTVFVSSHILSEVAQTCDHVAILSRGRAVASGPVREVLARGGGRGVLVRLEDMARALEVLLAAGLEATRHEDAIRVAVEPSRGWVVAKELAAAGLYPNELTPEHLDLEKVFLDLTNEPVVT